MPDHKNCDKQCVNNYRPVSLRPICARMLERLLFNEIFCSFTENDLIPQRQSDFKPRDSCINQLLSFTQKIYKLFHEGLDVPSVFLDTYKYWIKYTTIALYSNKYRKFYGRFKGLLALTLT